MSEIYDNYDAEVDNTDSGYGGHSEEFFNNTEKNRQTRLEYLLSQAGEYSSFLKSKLDGNASVEDNTKSSRKAVSSIKKNVVYVQESPNYITGSTLRPYQIDALNWLLSLFDNGISGILADEMGLGKTIQTISLFGYLKHYRNIAGPHLIVVPLSTLPNWQIEFERFCPSLNVVCLHGSKDERKAYKSNVFYKTKWDVCLTSYEMVSSEKAVFKRISWVYLVVDEAHRIKNENTRAAKDLRSFHNKYRLLLTGTPLQNNLHELWALLNFVLPDLFNRSDDFDKWFDIDLISNNKSARERLHGILRPFFLRRLKSEVEKTLKPKIEVQIYIGLTPMQRSWYKRILLKDPTVMQTDIAKLSLDNLLMHLRKVTMHPYLFLGAEEGPPYTTGSHIIENSGKMILLDKLLTKLKAQGSRVLIFSQMVRMLNILEDYCEMKNYSFCRLDGTSKFRQESIEEFSKPNSDKFIFLLSTRAGGLGINLASADVVIFYDSDWNPQVDLQAMDRAHRIGQQKQVRIFRLVAEHTVDEKMIETAKSKLFLDQVVIQSGITQQEKEACFNYGAEQILSADPIAITDDNIDEILERGEKKTREQTERMLKLKETEPIRTVNTKEPITIFEGENYKKKRKMIRDMESQLILTTKRKRRCVVFDKY